MIRATLFFLPVALAGCNQLFDISHVESREAGAAEERAVDDGTADDGAGCEKCNTAGLACVAGTCIDRRWPNGPIPEVPSCTPIGDGRLTKQKGTDLVWSTAPLLGVTGVTDAEKQCAALTIGEYDHFHVATRIELISLLNLQAEKPLRSSCTENDLSLLSDRTVCSSSAADVNAFYCLEESGRIAPVSTAKSLNYLCVQPTRGEPRERFEKVSGNVYDRVTNLTWQPTIPLGEPSSNQRPMTHGAALEYCRALGTGWTVPTVKQLQSIVDEDRGAPLLDDEYFPSGNGDWLWTLDQAYGTTSYWMMEFGEATTSVGLKPGVELLEQVRCVRTGR